ncbi:hypothetical protein [Roseomonas sp. CECT 9278]|uniref:hypothetical protein n=1 Tax=Roseomonas sp. CECT 9278 TaxID=2845823 RepID=UPI001E536808|nr:hypothetical protein [Roseomonas sp. CECT 9278]CAH0150324.1 hypothetical protein ROS9278_00703 [Roseomonas sp. CECT 9278]
MNQENPPGASACLDWTVLSNDLEAVFAAARRISSLMRLQATEHGRLRGVASREQLRDAWADSIHLMTAAEADLAGATQRLSSQASAILGAVMDAEDSAT